MKSRNQTSKSPTVVKKKTYFDLLNSMIFCIQRLYKSDTVFQTNYTNTIYESHAGYEYTDRQTDRRTDGRTDGRTDRQTDGQTDRQTFYSTYTNVQSHTKWFTIQCT